MGALATLRAIPAVLGLMVRVPAWALSYSLSYRRAKKVFKHQLIDQGVPKEAAEELADLFPFKMSEFIDTARRFN